MAKKAAASATKKIVTKTVTKTVSTTVSKPKKTASAAPALSTKQKKALASLGGTLMAMARK
jgi:hypothetical protein